jgi:cobaltochelatase CobT
MPQGSLARSLHILGPVLGRRRGAEVRIGGARACTDGNTIWLPALPLDDAEAAALGFGLLFHETNHLRYTDFTIAKGEGLVGALTNALEDIRIDRLGQQEYRGARREEEELVAALIRRGEAKACTKADHPARILESYLLWRLEYDLLQIDAARGVAERAEQVFRETFAAGVQMKLDALMFDVRDCRSTREVQALARDIAQLLDAEAQVEPAPRPRRGKTEPVAASPLRQALAATPDDHAHGIGELAQAALVAKGREAPGRNLPLLRAAAARSAPGAVEPAAFAQDVRAATHALRQRLTGLLQAETLCRRYSAAAGRRLDLRRLGRIETGEARIFVREMAGLKTDTAVQILVDRSGSMSSSRGREKSALHPLAVAREACFATASALQQVPGVAVAVAAFPGAGADEVAVIARFHERIDRVGARFAGLEAGGGTPLAEALLWGAGELLGQRNPRRILLVATDGVYDEKLGHGLTTRLGEAGIETLGIGIHCDLSHLFARSRPIAAIADLPRAMFEWLLDAMLRPAP